MISIYEAIKEVQSIEKQRYRASNELRKRQDKLPVKQAWKLETQANVNSIKAIMKIQKHGTKQVNEIINHFLHDDIEINAEVKVPNPIRYIKQQGYSATGMHDLVFKTLIYELQHTRHQRLKAFARLGA